VDIVRPTIVAAHPHDTGAFTQGLLLHDGFFYESTGLFGQSTARRVEPSSGAVVLNVDLPPDVFGEGLALVGSELHQLTWLAGTAYVRDVTDLSVLRTNSYAGQGWGLCHDGARLVMSDGSSFLTFRDPATFAVVGAVEVTKDGIPQANLNELECVGQLVYANVFFTDSIVRIDPSTGVVLTEIDASGLLTPQEEQDADVLNGIAFDPSTDRFFLTGKLWPWVFEVEFPFDPYAPDPCMVTDLAEVDGLRVGRTGPQGILFEWDEEPAAEEYHVNSVAEPGDLVDPGPHRPDLPGGAGAARCDAPAGSPSCADPDAIVSAEELLFYQVFSACGPGGVNEGP
jgi:glutaminyl-peptide cyclotransferase